MAYVDTTLPRHLRRAALSETYAFQCTCTACRAGGVDPCAAVSCPRSCGGMCPLPTDEPDDRTTPELNPDSDRESRLENETCPTPRCARCRASLEPATAGTLVETLHIAHAVLKQTTHRPSVTVASTDTDADIATDTDRDALGLVARTVTRLEAVGLVPAAHPLLALRRVHLNLLVDALNTAQSQTGSHPAGGANAEVLDMAICTAERVVEGLSTVLDAGHPVRAVALAELGKLLAVDEPAPAAGTTARVGKPGGYPPSGPARARAAYETLLRARKELLVAFGGDTEGGEVGQEVRGMIVTLEKELGVWTAGIRNALALR